MIIISLHVNKSQGYKKMVHRFKATKEDKESLGEVRDEKGITNKRRAQSSTLIFHEPGLHCEKRVFRSSFSYSIGPTVCVSLCISGYRCGWDKTTRFDRIGLSVVYSFLEGVALSVEPMLALTSSQNVTTTSPLKLRGYSML